MKNDTVNLSIDFLVGITIFIMCFIWVATMIPGILIGLQANTVDCDAVAYRTGMILVEDHGLPASWETETDLQLDEISHFGLAVSKDTPNMLSQAKVERFFCTTFIYPEDYQKRAIFGEYPYHFNFSVLDGEKDHRKFIGEIVPDGYGYIRRAVKTGDTVTQPSTNRTCFHSSSTVHMMSPYTSLQFLSITRTLLRK